MIYVRYTDNYNITEIVRIAKLFKCGRDIIAEDFSKNHYVVARCLNEQEAQDTLSLFALSDRIVDKITVC